METVVVEYGEHQLSFDPDEHRYWLDQDELLSVTKYLKLAGYSRPYNGDGSAAERGKHIHLATLYLDHGRLNWMALDESYVNPIKAWERFKQEEDFVPDLPISERPCYHTIYRYAGTPDRPGLRRGKPCVVEMKTGQPEKWHALQVGGGYKPMLASHGPTYAKADVLIVYLGEDGRPTIESVTDKRVECLFASLVATVNGRAFYGNYNSNGHH